jgi:adenylate kinase family enzyme
METDSTVNLDSKRLERSVNIALTMVNSVKESVDESKFTEESIEDVLPSPKNVLEQSVPSNTTETLEEVTDKTNDEIHESTFEQYQNRDSHVMTEQYTETGLTENLKDEEKENDKETYVQNEEKQDNNNDTEEVYVPYKIVTPKTPIRRSSHITPPANNNPLSVIGKFFLSFLLLMWSYVIRCCNYLKESLNNYWYTRYGVYLAQLAGARKIVVVGPTPGNGKTTLAKKIAKKNGLHHIVLDKYMFKPGFVKASAEEFQTGVETEIAESKGDYVIDGMYHDVEVPERKTMMDKWMSEADLVIWMDVPLYVLLWRLILRSFKRAFCCVREDGVQPESPRDLYNLLVNVSKRYKSNRRILLDGYRHKGEKYLKINYPLTPKV